MVGVARTLEMRVDRRDWPRAVYAVELDTWAAEVWQRVARDLMEHTLQSSRDIHQ